MAVVAMASLGRAVRWLQLVLYLVLAVALFYLLPFVWGVSTSFKTLPESVQGFDLIPQQPDPGRLPRGVHDGPVRPLLR